MTIDVRTERALALGQPRVLFRPESEYGLDHDPVRQRSLVAEPVGEPVAPLIVIQNWARLLEDAE